MNILDVIDDFERECDFCSKENYKSVFSASNVIMEYYIQKESYKINSLDDVTDVLYASYAYKIIQDLNVDQEYCSYDSLVEYNSILHKYLKGNTEFQVIKKVNAWLLKSKEKRNKKLVH